MFINACGPGLTTALFCFEQAPPFVRTAGPSFPLSQRRLAVEAAAMRRQASRSASVPPPLLVDADPRRAVLAMPLVPAEKLLTALGRGEVRQAWP